MILYIYIKDRSNKFIAALIIVVNHGIFFQMLFKPCHL